jgi:hypothetical protein
MNGTQGIGALTILLECLVICFTAMRRMKITFGHEGLHVIDIQC